MLVHFSECAGTIGSDWWSDIKWYADNIFIGAITHGASSGLMWNIAGNSVGGPKLPGTTSCGGSGCRPIVYIYSGGTYALNQECRFTSFLTFAILGAYFATVYTAAQASKAIIPKDVDGPWGKRIGVSVGGTLDWTFVVGAYVTGRVKSSDWYRYSLVVLNWYDNSTGTWDPRPVSATIEFRGAQVSNRMLLSTVLIIICRPSTPSLLV